MRPYGTLETNTNELVTVVNEIIVVRHGQTEWNRVERFRGRLPIELNETGLWQVQQVARKINQGRKIIQVWSSPLRRTIQTAEPIAALAGCPVTPEDGLLEADHGAWEALTPAEVEAQFPAEWQTWLERPEEFAFPGGESFSDLRRRVAHVLQKAASMPDVGAIVLVTHKLLCKMLVLEALEVDTGHLWQIEQDNAGIDVLLPSGGRFIVNAVNDICHLTEVPA
jgi:broad specificity phosphatase PhoE